MTITLTIPGRPVTWQRTTSYRGKRLTPKKYRAYKRTIEQLAQFYRSNAFGKSDVSVCVEVTLKHRGGQGDLDNYVKAALDGIQGILIDDDRQVVSLDARFVWASPEQMTIQIKEACDD